MASQQMYWKLLLATAFSAYSFGAATQDFKNFNTALPAQAKIGALSSNELKDFDSVALDGLSSKTISNRLKTKFRDLGAITTRGIKEEEIYRKTSPAVVIVFNDSGFGSGSYIGSNLILTNRHVVGSFNEAGIIFKPSREGDAPNFRNAVRAQVIKVDAIRDLALLKVANVPSSIVPLELGSEIDIQIGADVNAIGHPTGEAWTYTRGLISQYRKNYEWKTNAHQHRADVVQTQTPINPGNSGGPLLSDTGKLIGVNTFKAKSAEALNFAVSISDVSKFLKNSSGSSVSQPQPALKCKPTKLYDGRSKENNAHLVSVDTNCDGKADFFFLTPDDTAKAAEALIDSNFDGKIDIFVYGRGRSGRWEISFWDSKHVGKIDLVGYHPDGKIRPSNFEPYEPGKRYTAK